MPRSPVFAGLSIAVALLPLGALGIRIATQLDLRVQS
jgi:hypothetical protein